uniref:Interferon 1FA n=1 Tax=Ochotona princeps TaxID=9978 RepID=A0A7R8C3Q3_OCHPR|nr:TPA: interferon 1FA [Ochotona princeps]
MIQKCWWHAYLVCLFIIGFQALNYNLLSVSLNTVIWRNLRLLSSVSNPFPIECLREFEAFTFPQEILSYNQPAKRHIVEACYEISTLALQSTWEEKHLAQILVEFYHQVVYLGQCLKEDTLASKEEEMKYSDAMVFQLINPELRTISTG